jgi:hypothetical protein
MNNNTNVASVPVILIVPSVVTEHMLEIPVQDSENVFMAALQLSSSIVVPVKVANLKR